MAEIKTFTCIRPREGLESRVAALPYDVYSRQEAKEEVEREPYSFLAIDRAETGLDDQVSTYAPEVYRRAHDLLADRIQKGIFVREEKPCFYLYEQTMSGRTQTGLVACASVDDYLNGVIKKHENTRADKEQDRICHVDVCSTQTGPIFLAYRGREDLKAIFASIKAAAPQFSFVSKDGVSHRGWRIQDKETTLQIQSIFRQIPSLYIADGHHRAASAVKVAQMRRQKHPDYTGEEEFNSFLAILFPGEELQILDYNRVVKDLNGRTPEEFLEELKEKFTIKEQEGPCHPKEKGTMGLFLEDQWYELTTKEQYRMEDPVEGLDVAYLQREVLDPILGIKDPKTDKRIDFIGGIRGLEELERRVHTDCKAAFAMYPTSMEELYRVADAGLLMPPKSTWFEPKLLSGLFLHEIER
jgi:uncharacterized protein (DUF1015 family)